MKKILILLLAIGLATGLAAGGFFGGMAYQRSQANAVRNEFMRARGLDEPIPGGGMQGQAFAPPAGDLPGRGVVGQIKSIDGNTITLSSGQDETQVTLSENTTIQKTSAGTARDLQAGQQVSVSGTSDADGNFTADQVLILANDQTRGNTTP